MPVAATVAARSELAQARVLTAALRAQGITRHVVLVMDGEAPAGQPFEVVGPGELAGLPVLDPEELREALKPRLLERLLPEPVLLLDPDVDVRGPLDALAPSDGVVLVPRGDEEPGVYRSGVLGAGGRAGARFARWWAEARSSRAWTRRPPPSRSRSSATRPTAWRRGTSRSATSPPRGRSWRAASIRASRSGSARRSPGSRTTRSACWTRGGRPRTRRRGVSPHCPVASRSTAPWPRSCARLPTRSATPSPVRAQRSCWHGPAARPTAARSGASPAIWPRCGPSALTSRVPSPTWRPPTASASPAGPPSTGSRKG